jgi:3',5'-cyclic AMP phosphodiesterase CpdA
MISRLSLALLLFLITFSTVVSDNPDDKNNPPEIQHVSFFPDHRPARVMLSFENDPARSATVTWRTNTAVKESKAEITPTDPSPYFNDYETEVPAESTLLQTRNGDVLYHKVQFDNLEPGTTYLYRVLGDQYSSEWYQFTTAPIVEQPMRFIYLGDAQNKMFTHVSRVMRAAYAHAPDAAFVLHVGDLINHADNDYEWEEWYRAGGFIHAQIPMVTLAGNHEYNKNEEGKKVSFSKFWNPQFNFPDNHPIDTLDDQTYYFDYLQVRFIVLNSNHFIEQQADWLDEVLSQSTQKWNILAFHHPVQNAVTGRQNENVKKLWKPIIEKHNVDLVLQGHDHSYARGFLDEQKNGAVYVVSVMGEKMYHMDKQEWMDRTGENTQLYQIIDIENDILMFNSYTPAGDIYDAFKLEKQGNGANIFTELPNDFPIERTNENTLQEK